VLPRSVALCVNDMGHALNDLRARYGLRGGAAALERIDELQAELNGRTIEGILGGGLHEFLDMFQKTLGLLAGDISREFFHHEEVVTQSQSQSQ